VPPLELFRGAALALTSSIASKCVGSDELGDYDNNYENITATSHIIMFTICCISI